MMKPKADFRGARGANAGDQFHELWALQRALDLLNPSTALGGITVEGIYNEEDTDDENAAAWDGVDCALYFGGRSLATADRIDIVQLKYSGSDPARPWSIARLTANTRKTANNSVIRRLADAFAAARERMQPSAQLSIRLVSNQPIGDDAVEAITAQWAGPLRNAEIDPSIRARLERVQGATGLGDDDLRSFLRAIDFSECGSSSRFAIREAIVASASVSLGDKVIPVVRELQTRVRELMLPERTREIITAEVVLGWFDIANRAGLFPAPPELRSVENRILRAPATALADIIQRGERLVCLYGPAGCGKTTTLIQLEELLPEGSVFVAFDCYGAGRYIYSNDRRHLPENAFCQIANELSLKIGIPYLLPRGPSNPIDVRRFLDRLEVAAQVLKRARAEGLLLVGVDAADNAVTAALKANPPDPCFVHELAQADLSALSDNVRIVVSTRTARRDSLRLPQGTRSLECPPFELPETRKFVSQRFLGAPEPWIEQFHGLSRGVPRVQDYAMTTGGGDPNLTLNALLPSGKGVADVLRQLFERASNKAGDTRLYAAFVSALTALPAPIPPKHLAAVCNATEAEVLDIVSDIQPSLRLDTDGIAIADEDVEDFIHAEGAAGLQAAQRRARDHFSGIYQSDSYAATHYADMLVATGGAAEVLSIIERDLLPKGIADPIVRREVQLRRLRLALSACQSAGDPVASTKVLLLSAEASKDEAALSTLLRDEPDLSVRFARTSLMRLVLSAPESAPNQGSVLAQDAARAARAGDRVTARQNLHLHDIWLNRRRNAPDHEQNSWRLDMTDIMARAEAILLLAGPKRAIDELRRWSPRHLALAIGLKFIPSLIARGNDHLVRRAYDEGLLDGPWPLLLMVPLALSGKEIDVAQLENALRELRKLLVPDVDKLGYPSSADEWMREYLELIITACEIGFAIGAQKSVINGVLNLIVDFDAIPKKRPYRSDAGMVDVVLRAWLLRRAIDGAEAAVETFIEFADPSPPKEDQPRKGKRRVGAKEPAPKQDEDFRKYARAIFPVYQSRLRLLKHRSQANPLDVSHINWIAGFGTDSYSFERDYWAGRFRMRAARSVLRLMHLSGLPADKLLERAHSLVRTRFEDPFATRLTTLWNDLLLRTECHDFILRSVGEKVLQARRERAPASEKVEALVNFSRLVLNFSEADARSLFEEAVARAQEIDREAFDQIETLEALAVHFRAWEEPDRTRIACEIFRFVTDVGERLRNEENFPWDSAVVALGRLSPPAALASIARWADQGFRTHEDTLSTLIRELLRLQIMSPAWATALLVLIERANVALVGEVAAAARSVTDALRGLITEELAGDCLLNALPENRMELGSAIIDGVGAKVGDGPAARHLNEMMSFLKAAQETGRAKREESAPNRAPPSLDLSGRRFITAADIEELISEAREMQPYCSIGEVLKLIRTTITRPAERVPFLDAVASYDTGGLYEDERASAIVDALEAWKDLPSVADWRSRQLPRVIIRDFLTLSRWLKQGTKALVQLLRATGLGPAERRDVLIEGVNGTGLQLGSRALFGIADHLVAVLEPTDAWAVLTWYIARLNGRVPDGGRHVLDGRDLPSNLDDSIGRFIFALMGDVDTRIRWRAAHAARRLARLRVETAFKAIFANYNRTSDASFRDPTAPYYWLGGRLWLMLVAARVADERPEAILPFVDTLVGISLDSTFPHVLVRECAKAAVISLVSAGHVALEPDTLDRLFLTNTSPYARTPVNEGERSSFEWRDTKDRRFNFNTMDTTRYWYDPVLRLFGGLDKTELLDAIERWIIDEWKAPREANYWDQEPRKARYDERRFGLWSNTHGGVPIIERYGTHLEWHAMFCAIGELIQRYPLAEPAYEGDSFAHWLGGNLTTIAPVWLADMRGFTPLEGGLWFEPVKAEKQWLTRAARDEFLFALLPEGNGSDAFITVGGDWTAAFPTKEIRTDVSSALVSSETAGALVRALTHKQRRYGFRFPDEDVEDREIDEPPYRLQGWIRSVSHDGGLDHQDPLRNGISSSESPPGRALWSAFHLQAGPTPIKEWFRAESLSFRTGVWSDLPESYDDSRSHGRRTGSHGSRVQVRSDLLTDLLRSVQMDLIVSVHIERSIEREYGRSYDTSTEKRKEFERIFVFRSDGSIEDAKGRVGTWRRARTRVRR
jgi:hypothetical protein